MAGDNKPALVALRRRRDQVIESLSEHFATDALSVDEFEERLELAHQATEIGQLDQLLADLEVSEAPGPDPATASEPAAEALTVPEPRDLPAVVRPEEKKIRTILSSLQRDGEWRVPKRLTVTSVLGEARIDFRDVHLPPGVTEVFARSYLGSVEIIVPPTLAVECEGSALLGEVQEMHRAPSQHEPGEPRLVIAARAVLGELKVETRLPGETARDAKRRRKKERRAKRKSLQRAKRAKQLGDGS